MPLPTNNSVPAMELRSSATRNTTAFANSLGISNLPSGALLESIFQRCSAAPAQATRLFSPAISMRPGPTGFTRIRRPFESVIHVRANERETTFAAQLTRFVGNPFTGDDGRIQDDRGTIHSAKKARARDLVNILVSSSNYMRGYVQRRRYVAASVAFGPMKALVR